MPGDPALLYYSRTYEHIRAGDMNFVNFMALLSVGEIFPWGDEPYRILPLFEFNALVDGGLAGLTAHRMVHGTQEKFIDATKDGGGA
jgi:hypothetical protein